MTTALTDITMPQLSDQMEEGTIVSWLVEDGQEVAAGDEVVEVETDKATATHVTEVAGHIQIVAELGATLAVGEVIARVGPPGETDEPESEPEADPQPAADASAESADKPSSNGAGQP